MVSAINTSVHTADASAPHPRQRSIGNPILDQLDTNGDGVVNGFEHDFFLESTIDTRPPLPAGAPPGLISELFPAAGEGDGQ